MWQLLSITLCDLLLRCQRCWVTRDIGLRVTKSCPWKVIPLSGGYSKFDPFVSIPYAISPSQPLARAVCTFPAVPRSTQPSTLRGTVNEYQLSG